MSKKKKGADMPDMSAQNDGLPSDAELDALQAMIDEQKEIMAEDAEATAEDAAKEAEPTADDRVAELEMQMATLKDQALRAMADAENVKKRAEREVAAARVFGIERFANDVLSVYDNLSRALLVLGDTDKNELGENAKQLVEGIELTEKDLMAVLARHDVKAVPGVGSKFDPNVHQAVAQVPSDEAKGDVATVMQHGFTLGNRTLRAAMVAVSTGPAK